MNQPTNNNAIMLNELLNDKQVSELIGSAQATLRKSRMKGEKLLGVNPPSYLKLGRSVRYRRSTVLAWLESLEQYSINSSVEA
jgi:predicted DNA-binding transcriptional regulator AlpA